MKINIHRNSQVITILFIVFVGFFSGKYFKQLKRLEVLTSQINSIQSTNENLINSYRINLIPKSNKYPDFVYTMIDKTLFFYDAYSCSSCDSTLHSLSLIKDEQVLSNTVVVFNNRLGKRGLEILRLKLGNKMNIIELPDSVYYIKNSFLLQNLNGNISNHFITLPYSKELVGEYFSSFYGYLSSVNKDTKND